MIASDAAFVFQFQTAIFGKDSLVPRLPRFSGFLGLVALLDLGITVRPGRAIARRGRICLIVLLLTNQSMGRSWRLGR